MSRFFVLLCSIVLFAPRLVANDSHPLPDAQPRFLRGATPLTPAIRKLRATREWHQTKPFPPQWSIISPKNSVFLNDRYGNCVLAGECVNVNAHQYFLTKKPLIISDAEVLRWGKAHDVMNGAELLEVVGLLSPSLRDGLRDPSPNSRRLFCDGVGSPVNFQSRANVCSALYSCKGSLKMAVSGDDLERVGAGLKNGWYLADARSKHIDHDVEMLGYGTAAYCFASLNAPLPSGCDPKTFCYLINTWGTVGIVAADVVESSGWCDEIDVRTPTSVDVLPAEALPPPEAAEAPSVAPLPPSSSGDLSSRCPGGWCPTKPPARRRGLRRDWLSVDVPFSLPSSEAVPCLLA